MSRKTRNPILLLAIVLGLGSRALASTTATILVNGADQGGDANVITISFNGYAETVRYGQYSTSASIASAFGAMFTRDYAQAGLSAQVLCGGSSSMITFKLQGTATFGMLYVTNSTTSFQLSSSGFAGQELITIPTISAWPTSSTITYGQMLAASTLTGGSASTSGTFAWTFPSIAPAVGTSVQSVTFTPTDPANYSTVLGSANVTANQSSFSISVDIPDNAEYGEGFVVAYDYSGIGETTESVSSSTTSVCTVSGGTVNLVGVGTCTLTASATATAYDPAVTGNPQSFTVSQATPVISWPTPAPISPGTALSATQLNAASQVAGTFVYFPAAGTVLGAGSQTLSVTFTPNDTTHYVSTSATVQLVVNAPPATMTCWP